jgi:hypothetical protein
LLELQRHIEAEGLRGAQINDQLEIWSVPATERWTASAPAIVERSHISPFLGHEGEKANSRRFGHSENSFPPAKSDLPVMSGTAEPRKLAETLN